MPLTADKRAARPGTTLVELVVAISLMVVIMGAVLPLIGNMRNTWDTAQNNTDALQNGRVLINHLNLQLSQAVQITDVSPSSQTLGYIEFEDTAGATLRYDVGTDSYVQYGPVSGAAQENLAGPVSQLQFTCYDSNDFSTPITDANAIRFVKIQTTLSNQGVPGRDKAFATAVYLPVNGDNSLGAYGMGLPFALSASKGKEPALARIDARHYLCAYKGEGDDGWAVVLDVNNRNWNISEATPFEYDAVQGKRPELAKIDATHYLCAYESEGHDGWATILTVDPATWTLTRQTPLEFDPVFAHDAALAQIDDSHFLCAYTGPGDDGWAVVLGVGSGLAGHWTLDESAGTTAADSSDNGNHGTLTYMTGSEWTTGQKSGALSFDGSNDHIVVPNNASLQPTSALSICAWIRGDSWDSGRYVNPILRKGSTTPVNYQLTIADRKVSLMLDDMDENDGIPGDTTLNTGQWYHVAATWDGAHVRIYLNGILDNNPPDARSGFIGTDTRSLYIGGRGTQDNFDGLLDDVRLYSRALSAAEVAALAQGLRYEAFTEAKTSADASALTVSPPFGTNPGDLLVAAVATDGDTAQSLAAPGGQGWTRIDRNHYLNEVSLGAWWKLAADPEPTTQFTWSGTEQAYAWVMRFTGHNPQDPIDVFSTNGAGSSSPASPGVTTRVDNTLILRLGAFDEASITLDAPGLIGHTPITMDTNAGSGQVSFENLTEKKRSDNNDSITLDTPAGTSAGDLLIAAVVTDSDEEDDLEAPEDQGWTQIYLNDDQKGYVTLGVWWKLAGASEPGTHTFTWDDDQEAYAWMMRFTGHHPASPIHASSAKRGYNGSSSPDCNPVTTTQANCLILRIGGFDDDDINPDFSGLEGHSTLTMDKSDSGSGTCSGGAGFQQQATAGTSSAPDFNLLQGQSEQFVTLSLAIAPAPGGSGPGSVSGGAGYVKQGTAGPATTSDFALSASEQAQMMTLAISPATPTEDAFTTVTKGTSFEFAPVKAKTPALTRIDDTHYLCAYEGNSDDGWAVVLTVNPSNWTITKSLPFEFNIVKGKRPALAAIDSTHFLCVYEGDKYLGWATVLTVDPANWTLSQGPPFTFNTVKAKTPALVRMDSKRYVCVYEGDGDDGWSTVLQVNTDNWTISQTESYEFDPAKCKTPALVQIDTGHYLCTYTGNADHAWSVVLMPGVKEIQP